MQENNRRGDIYAFIHKGLRALMSHVLLNVGKTDWQDREEVVQTVGEVRDLLDVCREHLHHENTFVHTAMEARRPGSAARTAHDHVDHIEAIDRLLRLTVETEYAPNELRADYGAKLYRVLAEFVAENLVHMAVEERDNNQVLWETHSDAEIEDIHHAIVSSIPPERMMHELRWMLPHLSPAERSGLLSGLRGSAPAPVFQSVIDMLRPQLAPRDWNKLQLALKL